ncbi:type II toxin-antitoxin system HicB family antitoxin [Pseudooceanicola sp. 216_PA32_1]|uniref:Type II toxin-antitoxin system HicB family antitoxin n=1 Tax=Pseudooceanicola pacificus TaxID=2676438 RepID=A0A844W5E3_9RHOB|nr:type II toxin-antitoxin system HicB family antitoxin [Pseudooceanicola pacificus]MWB77944.1 type II toxin-antitoxin system HicB family antitoxin [Pseudooceanicola pacificus]
MLMYRVELTPDDNDTYLVTCPELPEVTSFGESVEDAVANGSGAIEEALAARLTAFGEIPHPVEGQHMAAVSSLLGIKLQLLWAMREKGWSRADLMRALGWPRNQVDRLFKADHATRLDQFDAAFGALARRLKTMVA